MGRGTEYEISTNMENCNLCLVKWFKTRAVTLVSNFVGSGNSETIQRWDKKTKLHVDVERPEIVSLYNQSMGGVDKVDQLISYYRTFIRSKKWTMRMIVYAVDLIVSNCWIQYLKNAEHSKIPKKNIKDLLYFRMDIGENLIRVGKPLVPKRKGQPRSNGNETNQLLKRQKLTLLVNQMTFASTKLTICLDMTEKTFHQDLRTEIV